MKTKTGTTHSPPCICVLGIGAGGFHWEAQRIVSFVYDRRPVELVLIFSGPNGGVIYWEESETVRASHIVRSPSLLGDSSIRKAVGMLRNFFSALKILIREKPDVILAIGTAQAIPFGIAARLLGRPLWFVESITRMRTPSLSGRLVLRLKLASRFYFYSKDLLPHYAGGICMEQADE